MRMRLARWITGSLAATALASCSATTPLEMQHQPPVMQAPPAGDMAATVPTRRILVAPMNDNFADARAVLELPYFEEINTAEATTESGEPDCFEEPKQTVWWVYTPPQDMTLLADASSFDYLTDISVWTGESVDNLTQIACNAFGATSRWDATAGVTYYIRTSTILGETGGTEVFSLRQVQPQITVEATIDSATLDHRTGLVTLAGTVTTNTPGSVSFNAQIIQRSGRYQFQGNGFFSDSVPGGTMPWSITVQANGSFKPGTILALLDVSAGNDDTFASIQVREEIKLERQR